MSITEIRIICAAATDTGKKRNQNEDTFICDQDRAIFLVADGMGGENYGEDASRFTAEHFSQIVTPFIFDEDATIPFDLPDDGDYFTGAMMHAADGANTAVYEYAEAHESHRGMGSTLTAAVQFRQSIYIAHIGDSRLYRVRGDDIQQMTEDHTKVQEMVRKEILTPEEARNHPQKNIITRCIGRKKRPRFDIFTIDYCDEDVFLICSDGLNDMIGDEEIHRIVVDSNSLETAAHQLVETANQNGGKDNITVVLFKVIEDGDEAELDEKRSPES